MVVLHGHELHALAVERVGRREVVGVQVVRDDLRDDVEEPLEVRDALAEGGQRLGVAQVADVVPDPGARALGQAEGALELRAAGQDRRAAGDREGLGRRDEPARAAQQGRSPPHDARDGVVGARVDRAVVQQHGVGQRPQPAQGVVVAERDRLVADVAAGQHERGAGVGQQQVVQRRVGEHDAELARARGHGGRDVGPGAPARQHDRPRRRGQERDLLVAQRDERPRGRQVGRHEREGLLLAVLARAQPRDRVRVAGAAGQVIPADALDGHDRPGAQQRRRLRDGVPARLRGAAAPQPRPRPAVRAGVRLGVEAPVGGVVVLAPARGAHREGGHRGQRPVVGDAAHDREARPAVRAVDERVAEAPVAGVEELGQAVVAGRGVGGDQGVRRARRPSPRSRSRCRRGPGRRARGRRRRGPGAARRSPGARGSVRRRRPGPPPRPRRPARRCGRSR